VAALLDPGHRRPLAAVVGGAGSRGRLLRRGSPPPIPRPCILTSAVAQLPLGWRSRATATGSAVPQLLVQGHRHHLRASARLPVAAAAKPDPPQYKGQLPNCHTELCYQTGELRLLVNIECQSLKFCEL
jgi:hypothetical protein